MMRKDNDELTVIIALLINSLSAYEDPGFVEHFFHRLRERLRRTESWNPELDELFEYQLYRDSPKHRYPLYRRVRDYLRGTQVWGPELDELLEYSLHRAPRRFREERDLEGITRGLMREFTNHIERNIERSNDTLSKQLSDSTKQSQKAISQIDSIKANQEQLISNIKVHEEQISSSKGELHEFIWLSSVGADFKNTKIKRYVPARIYISDPVPDKAVLDDLTKKLGSFVNLLGLEITDDFPEEKGSWWKRFFFKTREILTQDEVLQRVESAENALKLKHLDKPQAEANKMQAEAASQLIASLKDTPAACVQVGSLLLIKAPNNNGNSAIFTRTLTTNELKELEENQSILGKPEQVLEWLQGCNNTKQLPTS